MSWPLTRGTKTLSSAPMATTSERPMAWPANITLQRLGRALASLVECLMVLINAILLPLRWRAGPPARGTPAPLAAGGSGREGQVGRHHNTAPPERPRGKERFLREHGDVYGYGGRIDAMRDEDFPHIKGQAYLDHAGATLYSASQMRAVMGDLTSALVCNPHSTDGSGAANPCDVDGARRDVLRFLNASPDEYTVVFTSGATAALRLVGEAFPWGEGSRYWYTEQNHNSVLGIREDALHAGASAAAVRVAPTPGTGAAQWAVDAVHGEAPGWGRPAAGAAGHSLFAYPLECNFSGARFDPALAVQAGRGEGLPDGRWWTLLDAAKASATAPPNLSAHPVDFTVLSFYKVFGYPSGLGALVARKEAAGLLLRHKRYFGGGTVQVSLSTEPYAVRRPGPAGLEDGTLPFLAIAALRHGFSALGRLGGMDRVAAHAGAVARHAAAELGALRHPGGGRACVLYGAHAGAAGRPGWAAGQGPVVTFNLLRADGSSVGHREVEQVASLCGVLLRTGCMCNPGSCSSFLGLDAAAQRENYEAGHVCWDDRDIIKGRPTGAVRASFGYMSTYEDAARLIACVKEYFVDPPGAAAAGAAGAGEGAAAGGLEVAEISVYPIKSCAGFSPREWPLGPNGLLYDREWVLIDPDGNAITQKRYPRLAAVRPAIDAAAGVMTVTYAGCLGAPAPPAPLVLPLARAGGAGGPGAREVRVCGDAVCGDVAAGDAGGAGAGASSEWFSAVLGAPCRLVRQRDGSRHTKRERRAAAAGDGGGGGRGEGGGGGGLGFANEGQFLVVSEASVADVNSRLAAKGGATTVPAQHFRPNIVVAGCAARPYEEDTWVSCTVGGGAGGGRGGGVELVSLGPCTRCVMVNVDQDKAEVRGSEPLLTLASYRRVGGRVLFGVLMSQPPGGEGGVIRVGDRVDAH